MAVTQVDVGGSLAKGLQVNQLRQQMEAQKAQQQERNALKSLYAERFGGTDPKTGITWETGRQAPAAQGGGPAMNDQQFVGKAMSINPEVGLNWQQHFASQDAAQLERGKSEAPYIVAAFEGVQDQASYDQSRQMLIQQGVDVSDIPPQYDPRTTNMLVQGARYLAGNWPKEQTPTELARLYEEMNALPPDDPRRKDYQNAIAMKTTRAPKDMPSQGEGGPFGGTSMDAQVMNILLDPNADTSSPIYIAAYNHAAQPKLNYNPQTGQQVMITPDMSAFRPPAGRGGATPQGATPAQPGGAGVQVTQVGDPVLTEGEKIAAGFAERMETADKIITGLEPLASETFGAVEGNPNYPNVLKGQERRKLEQAQRSFVNAVLRKESGAVISDEEFANAALQYFPQPGDGPGVIEQKRLERKQAIENMRLNAARANKPKQGVEEPVTIGDQTYSQEDLEFTAKERNMTVEQVVEILQRAAAR